MKQHLHIKVSGEPSLRELRERSGARAATQEEFETFVAENAPFLPPDGEG